MRLFRMEDILFLVLLLATLPTMAEEPTPARERTLAEVRRILETGDSYQAVAQLGRLGDARAIAQAYSDLLDDLYWKAHDVQAAVAMGRAGLWHCLTQAEALRAKQPETSTWLRRMAQQIANNIGTYTWPGWNEKGIVIRDADLGAGLDAAQCSLRLVTEMGLDAQHVANGHWLLGAHYLPQKKPDLALTHFSAACEAARTGKDPLLEHLNSGYRGIALTLMGETQEGGSQLDEAVRKLKELKTEDADGCVTQLRTAREVFPKP